MPKALENEHKSWRAATMPWPIDWRRTLPNSLPPRCRKVPASISTMLAAPLIGEAIPHLARGAQILICGLMGSYQQEQTAGPDRLPDLLRAAMFNGVSLKAFTQVGQGTLRPAFTREIAALLASGDLKPDLNVLEGVDRLPKAMIGLFEASTAGKVVVRV